MNRRILFFVKLCIVFGFSAAMGQNRLLASTKHTIFFLHGFGGGRSTFLGFEEAFRAQLETTGLSNTIWEFKHFVYGTIKSGYRAKDFSKSLDKMIYEHFGPKGPNENQKFSFVGHSQGGLIASMWIFYTLEKRTLNSPEVLKNLDSLVTLGTPFWGSRGAVLGMRPPSLMYKVAFQHVFNLIGLNGDNEFESMSMGSEAVYNFRNGLIKLSQNESLRRIFLKNFKILNISGFIQLNTKLFPLNLVPTKFEEFETDGAVSLSSSRIDQLYYRDERNSYVHGDYVDHESFRRTDWGVQIAVPAAHAGIDSFHDGSYTPRVLAQVPSTCRIPGRCSHPAFMSAFLHLMGQTPQGRAYGRRNPVRSFLIDLNIRVPKSSNIRMEDIAINWTSVRDASRIGHTDHPLEGGMREGIREYEPSLYDDEKSEWRYFRYYFMGYLTDELPRQLPSRETYVGGLSFSGKGIRPRHIQVAFKPTYSTFIDIPIFDLSK